MIAPSTINFRFLSPSTSRLVNQGMSLITSWSTSCGLQDAYALNFTCSGPGCDLLASFPNVTCTTSGSTLTCSNNVRCTGTSDFQDYAIWSLDGTNLTHSESLTINEHAYPFQNQTGNPSKESTTLIEQVSATVRFEDGSSHQRRSANLLHALEPRARRLDTSSSPREDVQALIKFVRDTTKSSNDKTVQKFDADDLGVKIFDLACRFLAGATLTTPISLLTMTFRKECAALVAGLIVPLVVEAAGPLAPPALGVIAWALDKLCSIVIKQFVLTVVPDARQTYNSARKQFCNTAKCVVFTNTLSDPSNCGYCGNAVSILAMHHTQSSAIRLIMPLVRLIECLYQWRLFEPVLQRLPQRPYSMRHGRQLRYVYLRQHIPRHGTLRRVHNFVYWKHLGRL
jgi:hypothetical protein